MRYRSHGIDAVVTSCPKDGKKLRGGVCIVCGYTAPNATMSSKKPLTPSGPGGSGWRSRSGTSAGTNYGASTRGAPQPSAGASPPGSGASGGGAPSTPFPTVPAGSASPTGAGRTILAGIISELSPERYDTMGLGASNALGSLAIGLITVVPRAIGLACRIFFSIFLPRLGGAFGRGGGGRYGANRPDSVQVPGTPFVLDGDDGVTYDCYLRGEVRGGSLRLGEQVQLHGRVRSRTRVFEVAKVVNTRTGAVTTGYVQPKARMSGLRIGLQILLAVLLLIFLLSILRIL
jgi:hypothetical protein